MRLLLLPCLLLSSSFLCLRPLNGGIHNDYRFFSARVIGGLRMEPDVDLLNLRREQKSHEELILRAENELAQLLLPRDKERLEIQRLKDDIAQKKGSEEDLLGFEEELRRKREDFEKGSKTAETLQFQIDNSKSQIKICERMIADGERRVYLQANFNVRMGPGNPSYKSHYYRLKNRTLLLNFYHLVCDISLLLFI